MAAYDLVLDALGDPTRRQVLTRVGTRPASVAEVAAGLPVSRPAVSQHLRVLRDAGLVRFERVGARNVYRLDERGFADLRAWSEQLWADALGSFERHARRQHDERSDP